MDGIAKHTTSAEYMYGIKAIYDELKSMRIDVGGDAATDTSTKSIEEFQRVLNKVSAFTTPEYMQLGALIRFLYRNNKSEFMQFVYKSNMLHLAILTDGYFISKVFKIQKMVFIRWDSMNNKFIIIPIMRDYNNQGVSRALPRTSSRKKSRNSLKSKRLCRDDAKDEWNREWGSRAGGRTTDKHSGRQGDRQGDRQGNSGGKHNGGHNGTPIRIQPKKHTILRPSNEIKLGRRTYLAAAHSHATGVYEKNNINNNKHSDKHNDKHSDKHSDKHNDKHSDKYANNERSSDNDKDDKSNEGDNEETADNETADATGGDDSDTPHFILPPIPKDVAWGDISSDTSDE